MKNTDTIMRLYLCVVGMETVDRFFQNVTLKIFCATSLIKTSLSHQLITGAL